MIGYYYKEQKTHKSLFGNRRNIKAFLFLLFDWTKPYGALAALGLVESRAGCVADPVCAVGVVDAPAKRFLRGHHYDGAKVLTIRTTRRREEQTNIGEAHFFLLLHK